MALEYFFERDSGFFFDPVDRPGTGTDDDEVDPDLETHDRWGESFIVEDEDDEGDPTIETHDRWGESLTWTEDDY